MIECIKIVKLIPKSFIEIYYCLILPHGGQMMAQHKTVAWLLRGIRGRRIRYENRDTTAQVLYSSIINNYWLLNKDYLLTYSMVQSSSWEANWFAASQEIPRISRNPKVHYRTHKRPPSFSTLGQPNPVHIPTSHLLEFHPNIIHPSTPSLSLKSSSSCLLFLLRRLPITYIFLPSFPQSVPTQDVTNAISVTSFYCK